MKNWRKVVAMLLVLAMAFSLVACTGDTEESSTPEESTPVSSTVEEEPESSAVEEPESSAVEEEPAADDEFATPRNETLYLSGLQYGKPVDMNPLSTTSNFSVMSQSDVSRQLVYESLYMYNPMDAQAYGHLADGNGINWNEDKTEATVKIKAAAHWSDGTDVTAHDVVATWDAHVNYQTANGIDYSQYIASVTATDDDTVVFAANTENHNPLKVEEYLCKIYIMQKAYLEALDAELGSDAGAIKTAPMWDAPHTGAYTPVLYDSEQKWVIERDDNYWGQDASMWGKLPPPKYIAHNIFKDNDAQARALREGEVDVCQAYTANLQDMWEVDGLPISTYFDEPPYQLGMSMPSAIFNTMKEGLDQVAVRKAIAIACDYDQIVASAMTGQSYTFSQVPRSLFNPTDGEQAMIKDASVLEPYQFAGGDVEGAIALLDEAGIVDTDGDGVREYPAGNNLSFKAECPTGWSDWNAALTIVSATGQEIGIALETYFPEAAQYTEDIQTGNFDITMSTYSGAAISNPWVRAYQTMYGFGGNFPETMTFNYGRYYNARAEEILAAIPTASDEELLDLYEELNIIYLDEVPSFALMYRPVDFHVVNETVWTGYPEFGDENANIPPLILIDGYGYAGMFNIELIEG